jgi:predicted ATPase
MSRIKIKNFGPIKEGYQDKDGWLDINKVTVFVGNQGSGKSTVAKLISIFTKIEKSLVRGDYEKEWFEVKNKLKNYFLPYHRLENYLNADTNIEYQGEMYKIVYQNEVLSVIKNENKSYNLPQIMYVPAERNFLTYIQGAKELKLSSESLQDFNTEYFKSKQNIKGKVKLPINNTDIDYNRQYDNLYLQGQNFRIKITEASSGFQSFVPLYLVSDFLANSVKKQSENKEPLSDKEKQRFRDGLRGIWDNTDMPDTLKREAISELASAFNKTAFINIVEEPEQNLFPSSQWQMLQSLLKFNNINSGNKLIITTHSPYLINYLTLVIKAGELNNKIKTNKQKNELEQIVPLNTIINATDLSIYELNETDGSILPLETFDGLPSDENQLNAMLDEGNELFAQLLEIQQQL